MPVDNSVGARCDRIIRGLGGHVYPFSVAEKAQNPGVPDRRYYLRGVAFWMEQKEPAVSRPEARKLGTSPRPADRLSQGQLDFLKREYEYGQVVIAGDADALQRVILARPSDWRDLGWQEVALVVARGIRA